MAVYSNDQFGHFSAGHKRGVLNHSTAASSQFSAGHRQRLRHGGLGPGLGPAGHPMRREAVLQRPIPLVHPDGNFKVHCADDHDGASFRMFLLLRRGSPGRFFFVGACRRRRLWGYDGSERSIGNVWIGRHRWASVASTPDPSAFAVGMLRDICDKKDPCSADLVEGSNENVDVPRAERIVDLIDIYVSIFVDDLSIFLDIHTYMHTYVLTYVRTYIHTYACTCVHACMHTYVGM